MPRKTLLSLLFSGLLPMLSYAQQAVDMQNMKKDVKFLASDELRGREAGTRAEKKAAVYIMDRFKEAGLQPAGEDGYYQDFFFTDDKSDPENPHQRAKLADKKDKEKRKARNVLGKIDNGAERTVVIGGHYDHLGWGIEGSLHKGDSAIHNGADDNASGIAAIIQLAKILEASEHTRNNYVFIAFSGEEKGLLGSNYFVKHPVFDMEKINYMINLDMVGRLDEEKNLQLHGAGTSPLWKEAIDTIEAAGLKVKTSESGVGPSDHTSFYLHDVPVLQFFTGTHEDYHKPSDDYDKVNFEGMETITNSIVNLVAYLDDNGELAFTKTKDEKSKKAPEYSVTLGVVPDYLFDGKGMRIDGVSEGKTADKAGMKKGDIVKKMGDIEVDGMRGYMKALGAFEKGDKTTVVIQRGEETLEKEVVFQ